MSERTALRRRYPLLLQLGLLVALALGVTAFSVPLRFGDDVEVIVAEDEAIRPVEIEQTDQRRQPPPPAPPPPVEVPDDEALDDIKLEIDIEDIDTDPATILLPPSPPPIIDEYDDEPNDEIFLRVEDQPELIGGLAGLQSRIQYPELARRAGIEGTVFVQFVVDEQGNVQDPVCVRDPGGNTCQEALRAVRASQFEPGRQRGKPVKVRFSLPVRFRLR